MNIIPTIVSIGNVVNQSVVFAIQQFFTAILALQNAMSTAFPFIPPEVIYMITAGVIITLIIKVVILLIQGVGSLLGGLGG